jgi:hypothetical protein
MVRGSIIGLSMFSSSERDIRFCFVMFVRVSLPKQLRRSALRVDIVQPRFSSGKRKTVVHHEAVTRKGAGRRSAKKLLDIPVAALRGISRIA